MKISKVGYCPTDDNYNQDDVIDNIFDIPKRPLGRPTKYKEEYCEMLIDHMSKGLSQASFAGLIGVNVDTLTEWFKRHEAFSVSQKIGRAASLLIWERIGNELALGRLKGNMGAYAFNMKNRHKWQDRVEPDGQEYDDLEFTKSEES